MTLAAMVLTSCGQQQAESEKEVPLKVTYSIECSKDLMDLCDLVVTYKGDDGVDVIDTITATPADSTGPLVWSKTVGTHEIPVKIGLDYTFVQKADTLAGKDGLVSLTARYTIIAEKVGTRKGIPSTSENAINSKTNFFMDCYMMQEDVINTSHSLATIIDVYNDRQDYNRGTDNNKTCFIVKPNPHSKGLMVKNAPWDDNDAK